MEFDFGLYRYNMHAKTFGVGVGCCDDPTAMQAGFVPMLVVGSQVAGLVPVREEMC